MKIVYTCFCTDVIHEGHMNIIHEAKKYGRVVVGVLSDEASIRFNRFPGVSFTERINMVNVRHWDFADNFIWPQRIKFKDIEAFKVNSTIFEVNMKALTVPSVEIVGKFKNKIQSYMMRYVSKPKPIIIEDLATSDLSIDGYTEVMECELPEDCHEEILERAVTLAKLAYEGTSATLARANNNQ